MSDLTDLVWDMPQYCHLVSFLFSLVWLEKVLHVAPEACCIMGHLMSWAGEKPALYSDHRKPSIM